MLTLIDALRRTVLVNGDRNATVYKDRTQTWKELAGRVARLANALQKRGCGRGSRMANLALNRSSCEFLGTSLNKVLT
ncbi:AMP-binding enzyme [Desulfatibacillum alkenivorans DSM 16219]|jgi:acyl-CoA synthetase (AMP-forming)/AMP-acid ligase II|uniref:AMP-binding enzyme n=1 Tax=Desulfatibacillum alkenivorans DSM 16219 TaxID=1121393 RepID=A0A1M7ABU1_9BACT|nr:AMP-binding protein [Desulfatibacillum alkenivorans]SHL40142.1 AMP-binding enzyme [Desulfatibacillum alkenivorans DSM 16219]